MSPLSALDVIAFLQTNPEFLVQHRDALTNLALPEQAATTSNVTLLANYQAEQLKKRLSKLQAGARQVIETSVQNHGHQQQIHALVLDVLACPTLAQVWDTLCSALQGPMGVDTLHLALLPKLLNQVDARENITALPEKKLAEVFAAASVRLQGLSGAADPVLHGPGSHGLRSEAIVRLFTPTKGTLGALALGAREAGRFQADDNGDLLLFLGGVLGHKLQQLLNA